MVFSVLVSFLCNKIPEKKQLKEVTVSNVLGRGQLSLLILGPLMWHNRGTQSSTVVAGKRSRHISRECQQGTPLSRNAEGQMAGAEVLAPASPCSATQTH